MIQVLTYEWAALHQAKQLSPTLTTAGHPAEKIKYLVNRSDSTGGMSRDAIAEQIGREQDFDVVSDGILALEADNRDEPFIKLGPDAPISRDVARIAHHLSTILPATRLKAAANA